MPARKATSKVLKASPRTKRLKPAQLSKLDSIMQDTIVGISQATNVPVEMLTAKIPELSGGPVSYYLVQVARPNQVEAPYVAECSDIIEALGMDFNEGEAFKALWRKAAARTLGKHKAGNTPLYDAQKVEHYGKRLRIMTQD